MRAANYDCPKCGVNGPCQKKGKDKNEIQKFLCKSCGKTFIETEINGTTIDVISVVKSPAVKAPVVKEIKEVKIETKKEIEIKETKIIVNSNVIKTVKRDLSVNEAFDIAVSNFKELKKSDPSVNIEGSTKMIAFKIKTTHKG